MIDNGVTKEMSFSGFVNLGPLLKTEADAFAFADAILTITQREDWTRDQPRQANDLGEHWAVEGGFRFTAPGAPEQVLESGRWRMKVRKADCRIEDFKFTAERAIPDEVRKLIDQAKAARRPR